MTGKHIVSEEVVKGGRVGRRTGKSKISYDVSRVYMRSLFSVSENVLPRGIDDMPRGFF